MADFADLIEKINRELRKDVQDNIARKFPEKIEKKIR